MATEAFRKWNLAVCKKMSCINTPGFLTLCTSKGSFVSTRCTVLRAVSTTVATNRPQLVLHTYSVCVWCLSQGQALPACLDSSPTLPSPWQGEITFQSFCTACRVMSQRQRSNPLGRTNPETWSPNECVLSDKIYVPNKVIFYCSVYVQAGKRWTLYIRITTTNEVIKCGFVFTSDSVWDRRACCDDSLMSFYPFDAFNKC